MGIKVLLLVAALIAVGCGAGKPFASGSTGSTSPVDNITPEPAGDSTGPGQSDTAASGPSSIKIGEPVSLECGGSPCLIVTVLKTTSATRYKDPEGYLDDVPDRKGDVFIGAQVKYEATGPNADYNPFDWALYVNDDQVQDTAYLSHGPTPALGANDLPKGKRVTGWIFWEVPKAGRVTLAYEPGNSGAIFELVVRSK